MPRTRFTHTTNPFLLSLTHTHISPIPHTRFTHTAQVIGLCQQVFAQEGIDIALRPYHIVSTGQQVP